MKEILLDCILDVLKIVPFLFIAFLLIEFLEHHLTKKNKKILIKSRKYSPILGGILGMIPQCGFSALATNLFSSNIITLGTLIAVYLSTSDEMFMVLISGGISLSKAISIILIKALIGIFFGFLIDIFIKNKDKVEIHDDCDDIHCDCKHNIVKASIKHSLKIALYIFIASIIISLGFEYIGESNIKYFINQSNYLTYVLSSIIGLIPNCSASVIITELYCNNILTLGQLMSGLLTASGVGYLVLFRTNKKLKQNIAILLLCLIIGIISGLLIDMIGLVL